MSSNPGRRGARLAQVALAWVVIFAVGAASPAGANPDSAPAAAGAGETVEQALCRLIDAAATKQRLPVAFLTQLIWQESSFRANAISSAGAQGVAQFMPGTAQERGLANPFDPEQAIPASAAFLAELRDRFGNLGLAAAAYNGGPARVAAWIAGTGGLPLETQDYVMSITGRAADDWLADLKTGKPASDPAAGPTCAARVAELRATSRTRLVAEAPFAPWGVQLSGNFSKARALATYARARLLYASVVGDTRPMIIGTRLRTRGTRAFYRVRVPADTRAAAIALCDRIHAIHGSCIVLRS